GRQLERRQIGELARVELPRAPLEPETALAGDHAREQVGVAVLAREPRELLRRERDPLAVGRRKSPEELERAPLDRRVEAEPERRVREDRHGERRGRHDGQPGDEAVRLAAVTDERGAVAAGADVPAEPPGVGPAAGPGLLP